MKHIHVRKDTYVDSVFLMLLSKELKESPDISDATVTMGTPMNLNLLKEQGYSLESLKDVTPADLIIALDCGSEKSFETALVRVDEMLAGKKKSGSHVATGSGLPHSKTLDSALELLPDANLAIISVPGMYASREVRKALNKGLHVMLFSDNVSLEDEIALKKLAKEKGLLVMGPDCGTAIIDGKPICFANVVDRGPVGIVAAAGTGLQEVSCLIDRFGSGVSQAIGTGGRDLKNAQVGGTTMLMAIEALGADPETKTILIVSKPPAPEVASKVVEALEKTGKPAVVHFIGLKSAIPAGPSIHFATNLEEASRWAVALAQGKPVDVQSRRTWPFDLPKEEIEALVDEETRRMSKSQKYIRGYYTGGTLTDEAWILLHQLTGAVYSNNQTDPAFVLPDPKKSIGHTIVDLGDDVFTVGRPHPMIDPSTRTERIDAERDDPEIAVMLLDCVLGYGSHEDPAGAMIPSIIKAKDAALKRGGYLSVIASVTGTPGDFQGFEAQVAKLRRAGVIVMPSNYQAAMLALKIMEQVTGKAASAGTVPDTIQQNLRHGGTVNTASAPLNTAGSQHILSLFNHGLKVINLGLESFAKNLQACETPVVHVDWVPPAGGNPELIQVLDRLEAHPGVDIEKANAEAVERILSGKPVLKGIGIARDTIPGMKPNLFLHAGPPVTWERMCGPMRGAVIGGLLYEGLAKTEAEAEALAASGKIEFSPCQDHSAVGPMAGIVTPRMPVWIIENETFGNRAYATLNEGLGKVLRYGAYSPEVLDRLRWMETELAPILQKAIERHGPVDMRSLIVQALQMGDEGHNRNRAGTSLVIRELAPYLVMLDEKKEALSRVLSFMHQNDHFFLNLTMPSAKSVLMAAEGIPGSTVITAQGRNGTEFGIQVAGLKGRWFTGPAGVVNGLYLPGFGPQDAALDIGDSVITETSGIGGFAMAAAPAIVKFVGGSPEDALRFTREMYEITLAENREYKIPILDFRGTPTAIDVRKVVEKGILPVINTGIAHKKPGIGMVGAGLVKPPVNCYQDALKALAEAYTK
jgi:succinyl-CoA synthetase alpha subunit